MFANIIAALQLLAQLIAAIESLTGKGLKARVQAIESITGAVKKAQAAGVDLTNEQLSALKTQVATAVQSP